MKKHENKILTQEKNQSIETNPDITKLADKDCEWAIVNMFRDLKKNLVNAVRNMKSYNNRAKCNF